jgi:hypothetical protein
MSTAVQALSSNRIRGDALVVSSGIGRMGGMVIITTSSAFNLTPGVNVTGLNGYFYEYIIITNSVVAVTLPLDSALPEGWRCKIIAYSPARTGVVVLLTDASTRMGLLDSSFGTYNTCELMKSGNTNSLWRTSYGQMKSIGGLIRYSTFSPPYPIIKPLNAVQFFSFSGSTPVDVTTTFPNPVKIPWEFNSPGRFVDTDYFVSAPASNTRIQVTTTCFARIRIVIPIDNTNGAITTTNVFPALTSSGTIATLPKEFYQVSAEPGSTTAVITIDAIQELPIYFELSITKTSGAGSNFTIPSSTYASLSVVKV